MPFGSFFDSLKSKASDMAEQYGGGAARELVEEGFERATAGQSESGSLDVGNLMQAFTGKQQGGLSDLLSSLSGSAGGLEDKAAGQGMDPQLTQSLMGMVTGSSGGAGSGFDMGSLIQVAQSLTKGGSAGGGSSGFLSLLSDAGSGGSSNGILSILMSLAKSFFSMKMGKDKSMQDWDSAGGEKGPSEDGIGKWADNVIGDLVFPGKKPKDIVQDEDDPRDKDTDPSDVRNWFDGHPEIGQMQKDVFDDIFDTTDGDDDASGDAPLIPAPTGFQADCSILDHPSVLFLNTKLLLDLRKEWRFLFSTRTADPSANLQDMIRAIQYQGPTILVFKATDGTCLGAFASTSWAPTEGGWIGNGDSFIFSLHPKMSIFYSTGKDDNIMFLDDRSLALGGKTGRFGLAIDSDLKSMTYNEDVETFDLPSLTGGSNFDLDHVEAWGVGPEPDPSEEMGKIQVRRPDLRVQSGGNVDINDLMSQMC